MGGIGLLGPLQVNGEDAALAPRDRVILVALALRVGEVLTAEQLADALWGDEPPATWSKALQGSIVRLRKLLGQGAIRTVDHGYRLTVPPAAVDARAFERRVAKARELLDLGEPDRAEYAAAEALSLWRGPVAATDLDGWEPGRREADRLAELRRDAEELRLDSALRTGRHRDVLADARSLVEEEPLRERRWELLALGQYRSGQQADALQTLHQLRRVLNEELGIDPGPAAAALEQSILRQDPALEQDPTSAEPSRTCPYPGLLPYDITDADGFFGRAAEVQACRDRLDAVGVLAVVGPSGSGKSSLVRAGLAAALARDGERIVVVTPGRRPTEALTALPDFGRPAVLVVDQVEEAMTVVADASEVERFFGALTRHADRAPLVVAMRADRFGDLAAHPDFARLVERGLHVLTPMSPENLREAIEGPARLAGLRLETGLAELLVAEVEGQSGALPYLSHALRQTWERREGAVLTIDGYRASGGIKDAVARSAERVHAALPPEERALLRDLMRRLVVPGPEGEPVRSRVPRRLLAADPRHDQVLERLVAARLVTSDDGVVEIAHEALVRAWPRLRGWLDEDTEGQRILRHLSLAADSWNGMGRPDDELYRGTRLAQVLEWRARAHPDLTVVERDFLRAGDRRAREAEATALERAVYQSRVNRRLRVLLVGAALLLVVSTVAGTLAVRQANRAAEATRSADARRVAAQAQLVGDIDSALALAAAAVRVEPSEEARAGLRAALARSPQLAAVRPLAATWMDVSPRAGALAAMGWDHEVAFHDARTFEPLGEYDPYPDRDVDGIGGNLAPLAWSDDGDVLAVALLTIEDGVVRLVDGDTFRPLAEQPGRQPRGAHTNDVELSRDGRYLAASLTEVGQTDERRYRVHVWDLTRPARQIQRIVVPSDTFHVEFSPDGRRLHAAPAWNSDADPGMWTYDTRTGELLGRSRNGGQGLQSSPDGQLLGYGDGSSLVLLDEGTGRVRHRFGDPRARVGEVAFSPDGRQVAAITEDPAAFVWDIRTGRLREEIGLPAEAYAVDFDPSGRRLLVPSDGRLHAFDLTGRDRYVQRLRLDADDGPSEGLSVRFASPYSPVVAESLYAPSRGVSMLEVVDRATGSVRSRLGLSWIGDRPDAHAWSPDGGRLALVDSRDVLRIHDWRTGRLVARRSMPAGQLAFTADGSRLFVDGPRGLVLLDAETLGAVTEPAPVVHRVTDAVLLPGDERVVVVTAQRTASPIDAFTAADRWQVVDLVSGETLGSGRLREPANSLAVSPDGSHLAVASSAGVEVVDLATSESRLPGDPSSTAEAEGHLVTWSPDGSRLASSDSSGRVSLWDARSGALLGTVHEGNSRAHLIFQDDDTLLMQHFDGSAYLWDTSLAHAVDTACRIVGRGLTREEWSAAFGESREYVDVCASDETRAAS